MYNECDSRHKVTLNDLKCNQNQSINQSNLHYIQTGKI